MLFSRVQKFKYCHFLLEKNDMLVGPYFNLPYESEITDTFHDHCIQVFIRRDGKKSRL